MANEKRLIDAIAFGKVLSEYYNATHIGMDSDYYEGMQAAISNCIRFLEEQPSVDAVPVVHGRWAKNWDGDNIVYCSQCYMPQDIPTPYCHSCGAKMDGERGSDV